MAGKRWARAGWSSTDNTEPPWCGGLRSEMETDMGRPVIVGVTVDEAVQIARRHMRKRGCELSAELRLVLWRGDWVVQSRCRRWVYLCAATGRVMSPCSEILYSTFRDPAPPLWPVGSMVDGLA